MTALGHDTFNEHLLRGDFAAASAFLDGIRRQEGGTARYWHLRGDLHYRASEFAQALDMYIKVGHDFPGYVDHRYHLADVCSHLGLAELGAAELQRLVDESALHRGLKNQILAEGWTALAMDEQVIALDIEDVPSELCGHVLSTMRGQSQMKSAGTEAGLDAFRAGFCTVRAWQALYPGFDTQNYWCGQSDLPRQLQIRSRGGMGDLMQWVRYVEVLRSAGVTVEVPGLNELAFRLKPADDGHLLNQLAARGYRMGEGEVPMWTDPFTLFTALFPVVGHASRQAYLELSSPRSVPVLLGDIRRRARGRPCIGLFWSANESPAVFAVKSLELRRLDRLLEMDDVHWVIFQRGYQRALWLDDPRSKDMDRFTTVDSSMTFDESIALGSQLDAMVSIDSGLIHGCAALGTPCVLMAHPGTDWRWGKSEGSAWYPTVTIARVPVLGDWDGVVDKTMQVTRNAARRARSGVGSDYVSKGMATNMTEKINAFLTLDSQYGKFIVNRNCALQAEALVKTGKPHIQAELDNMIQLMQHLPDKCIVVDGGANIGLVSIPLAKAIASRSGVVHAFEPQRLLNYALCGSVALNHIENLVVHRKGLAASKGVMRVPLVDYSQPSDYGTVQLLPQGEAGGDLVNVIALDDMGLERLDFLKLDIEGMEIEALRGASKLIAAHRPWCWIEYWMIGIDAIRDQFSGLGYEFFKVDALNLLCAPTQRWDRNRLFISFEAVQ